MSNWEFSSDPHKVHDKPACYAIYIENRLVYIGSTFNLRKRMYDHFKVGRYSNKFYSAFGDYGCEKVTVKYRISNEYGDWAMLELKLIKRLKPIYNKKLR